MDPEPIRAQFTFTEEDALATIREGARDAVVKQQRVFAGLALLAGVLAGYFWMREGPSSAWTFLLVVLTGAMAFSAWRVPRNIERVYEGKIAAMPELGRRVTFTIGGNLLYTEVEGLSEGSSLLSGVLNAEDRTGGLLLTVGPENYVFIPDRAFAAPSERIDFLRRLRAAIALPGADLPT